MYRKINYIAGSLAASNPSVSFIILLGGPIFKGMDLLLQQAKALLEKQGIGGEQMEEILEINRKLPVQAMLLAGGYPPCLELEPVSYVSKIDCCPPESFRE
jgi:hypothetical protein